MNLHIFYLVTIATLFSVVFLYVQFLKSDIRFYKDCSIREAKLHIETKKRLISLKRSRSKDAIELIKLKAFKRRFDALIEVTRKKKKTR